MSCDAGRVVRIDKREDEMQTTYHDLHGSDGVTVSWPDIEDLAWHISFDFAVYVSMLD